MVISNQARIVILSVTNELEALNERNTIGR